MTKRHVHTGGLRDWMPDDWGTDPAPYSVDLSLLGQDLHECIIAKIGPLDQGLIDALIASECHQAPVETPNMDGIGWRLVSTEQLAVLAAQGKPLEESEDNFISVDALEMDITPFDPDASLLLTLPELFSALSQSPALLIYSCYSMTCANAEESIHEGLEAIPPDEEGNHFNVYGLITIADVNKPIVRKIIYDIFLDIEVHLSELLIKLFQDPGDWIHLLDEESKIRALGYWQLSRSRGYSSNPVACLTLTELLGVTSRVASVLSLLGYNSRSSFINLTGALPKVRNSIMHPVRPLVQSHDDMIALERHVQSAMDLRRRSQVALVHLSQDKRQKKAHKGKDPQSSSGGSELCSPASQSPPSASARP
jgi:hypothetical protein